MTDPGNNSPHRADIRQRWQSLVQSLKSDRSRSRRRPMKSGTTSAASIYSAIECLEARQLLTSSYGFEPVAGSEGYDLGVLSPVVTSKGILVSATNVDDVTTLQFTDPAQANGPVDSTYKLKGVGDFDVNADNQVVARHQLDHIGDVVSIYPTAGSPSHLLVDTTAPRVAKAGRRPYPQLGDSAVTFDVYYADYRTEIDRRGINGSEIDFRGSNGQVLNAVPYGFQSGSGVLVVSYVAQAPGGTWDAADNGIYTVSVKEGGVRDFSGNPVAATEVYRFERQFDPDQKFERKTITVTPRQSHPAPERYNALLENLNRITFINQARVAGLGLSPQAVATGFENSVAINDHGQVAFSIDTSDDRRLFGTWKPQSDLKLMLSKDTIRTTPELDLGNNGLIAASIDRRATLIDVSRQSMRRLNETTIWTGEYQPIRMSPDGTKVFYSPFGAQAASLGVFVYDTVTGTTHRLIGSLGDRILDPGERWRGQGAARLDVSSQPGVIRLIGSGRDSTGRYWIMYDQASVFGDESADVYLLSARVYARSFTIDEKEHTLDLGTPILIGAAGIGDGTRENLGRETFHSTVSLDSTKDGFHSYLFTTSTLNNRTTRVSYKAQEVPDVSLTGFSSQGSRHAELERLAREIAYWELRDPRSRYQIGSVLDNGYVIEGMYVETAGVQGTFEAVVLLPFNDDGKGEPILAIRGSDPGDLTSTVWEESGIGYSQFQAMESWVVDWIGRVNDQFDKAPILTGHSLGGALSQWFTTSIMAGTEHDLTEVVTFNSPGISHSAVSETADAVRSRIQRGVTHYVVSGDIVSLAGEAFLEGQLKLYRASNSYSVEWSLREGLIELPRHTRPILVAKIADDEGGTRTQLEITQRQSFSTEVLNHPEFNYLADNDFVGFLSQLSVPIGQNSHHLVARQRTEAIRAARSFNLSSFAALLFKAPGPSQVFVSVDVERSLGSTPTYVVGQRRLVATPDTQLIAATVPGGPLMLSGGSMIVPKFYKNLSPAVVDISDHNRKPGQYRINLSTSFLTMPALFEIAAGSGDTDDEPVNTPPQLQVPERQTIQAGQTLVIPLSVSDSDGDSVTLEARMLDSGQSSNPPATLHVSGRDLQIAASPDFQGTLTVEIQASDGQNVTRVEFQVVVEARSDKSPPELAPIDDVTALPHPRTTTVELATNSASQSWKHIILGSQSSNRQLLPPGAIRFGGGVDFRTLVITPAAGQSGTADVTIFMLDRTTDHGSRQTFRLTVKPEVPDTPRPITVAPNLIAPEGTLHDSTPTFTWSVVPGASRYELWIDNRTTGEKQVVHEVDLASTSFTPAGDLATGRLYVWIRAANSAGQWGPWSRSYRVTLTAAVGKPTFVSPGGSTSDQAPTISWDSPAGAVRYELWIDNRSSGQRQVVHETDLTATSFTTATMSAGNYVAWVRASNAQGEWGAWSDSQRFTIAASLAVPELLAPTGTIAQANPKFQWSAVRGAVRYELWVDHRTSGRRKIIHESALTLNSLTPSEALPDGRYRAWVRAADVAGNWSEWSRAYTFSLSAGLAAPQITSPGSTTTPTPTIRWTAVAGAAQYELWIDNRTTRQSQVVHARWLTTTSFNPAVDLPSGLSFDAGTYAVWVRAADVSGRWGDWSRVKIFTVSDQVASQGSASSTSTSALNRVMAEWTTSDTLI